MTALLLAAALAGCATLKADPPTPTPAHTDGDAWSLGPNDSTEFNVGMAANASIEYVLDATEEVTWDLHSHLADRTVETHAQGKGQHAEGRFVAPREGVYSLFAKAGPRPTNLTIEATGDFEVIR